MLDMPLFKRELHTINTYYLKNTPVLLVFKILFLIQKRISFLVKLLIIYNYLVAVLKDLNSVP